MPYYHYTGALDAIVESGIMYAGDNHVFGEGVYFTSMCPSKGKKQVSKNNWDGIWEIAQEGGKMEGVIKIYGAYDNDDFQQVGKISGRDVVLYGHDELDLSTVQWAAFSITWSGNSLRKLTKVASSGDGESDEEAEN